MAETQSIQLTIHDVARIVWRGLAQCKLPLRLCATVNYLEANTFLHDPAFLGCRIAVDEWARSTEQPSSAIIAALAELSEAHIITIANALATWNLATSEWRSLGPSSWNTIRKQVAQSGPMVCHYCGKTITDGFHVDHVIPRSQGGGSHLSNLVLSCAQCNLAKGGKTPDEWRR